MFPAQHISKHCDKISHSSCGGFYGGCGCGGGVIMSQVNGYEYHRGGGSGGEACLGSDLGENIPMAEDESRTNSLNHSTNETATSSSKNHVQDETERDEGWLQLSIGGRPSHASSQEEKEASVMRRRGGGLVELDLLSGSTTQQQTMSPLGAVFNVPEFRSPPRPMMHSFPNTPLFYQQQGSSNPMFPHPQEIGWVFRPITQQSVAAAAAAFSSNLSSPSLIPLGWRPPFQVQTGMDLAAAGPSTSLEFKIIDPPRRPHSGIWFMLQASQNQSREPFLPQIPKNYLRIKDGKMTVRLLMKYLVNKLRLDSESEVEITCRGQQLLPFLTLQHVRDNIWSTRDAVTLLPESSSSSPSPSSSSSSTSDHLMVLHYGRSG